MDDNLKNLLDSFKTQDELRAYVEAQQLSLIEVSKKMRKLEEERDNLDKKVKKLEIDLNQTRLVKIETEEVSNSEVICLSQIESLKRITEERTLTYEEAKRLEIYHKILGQITLSKKNKDSSLAKATDEELLKLINGGKTDG